MIKQTLAIRYAKALFELDKSKENREKSLICLDSLMESLFNNPKLMKVLSSPQILQEEKKAILREIFKDRFNTDFFHFLYFLIEKGRLNILKQIREEYQRMLEEYLGIWEATIVTAIPIGSDVENGIKGKLENYYKKAIKIKSEVDSHILGGAILIHGNEMVDWSVKERLKKLKEKLLEEK